MNDAIASEHVKFYVPDGTHTINGEFNVTGKIIAVPENMEVALQSPLDVPTHMLTLFTANFIFVGIPQTRS